MFDIRALVRLPPATRGEFLQSLTPAEARRLYYEWDFWARPDQRIPHGDWLYWIPLGGRGWGKTRTGAEAVRRWARDFSYVNLIGPTLDDAREVMVEGESGVLSICPPWERPRHIASRRRLEWPNGAVSLIFSANEPDRLRGKQHMKLWADELAAWRYPQAWDQALMGLRLGAKPQAIVTTTPRPTKLMRDLLSDPLTYSTRGSTFENAANLAEGFLQKITRKYQGSRLGRQELEAELLFDAPGALWTREGLETCLHSAPPPPMARIVAALDPPVTSGENADECGLIVAGRGEDGRAYILADLSSQGLTPLGWAARAVEAAHRHNVDCIVAEVNNGGEMIESVLRQVDASLPVKCVRASHGKYARAEPVAALYEQGRVAHCGAFPRLEDQMCAMTPHFDRGKAGYSPDRVDALVWALTELMLHADGEASIIEYYRRLAKPRDDKGHS